MATPKYPAGWYWFWDTFDPHWVGPYKDYKSAKKTALHLVSNSQKEIGFVRVEETDTLVINLDKKRYMG